MAHDILLSKKIFHLAESNLPCLVIYREKEGGSQFSIALIADLFLRGSKILFLTAFPFAKEKFFELAQGAESKIIFIENEMDLKRAQDFQAIILKSGDGDLFLKAMRSLADINERIIFIKNIEFFNDAVIDSCLKLQKVIFSGDIGKSSSKKQISEKLYKTIIAFSKSETVLSINVPKLEKYSGYFWSEDKKGVVKLEM